MAREVLFERSCIQHVIGLSLLEISPLCCSLYFFEMFLSVRHFLINTITPILTDSTVCVHVLKLCLHSAPPVSLDFSAAVHVVFDR